MPDIIVVGDINVDLIFTIPGYPAPGSEAVASSVQIHTGGSAVNTAIALAKMGMDVGFIGRIGQDALAKQVLDDLTNYGVDCSLVQVDNQVNTGMILIAVSADGERTMFSARGANVFTDAATIDRDYFANCRWIHLSGYTFLSYHQREAALLAMELAKHSRHTRISLDIGIEPATQARKHILEVLPKIDVIFPNELELLILSEGRSREDALTYLIEEKHAGAIVAKFGSQGSRVAVGSHRQDIPAFNIEVKDTTGAGDSFNAGVVFGRSVGLSWGASVALGNAFGGIATSQDGAGAHAIDRNTIVKMVEKHMFYEDWLPAQQVLEELSMYFEGLLG